MQHATISLSPKPGARSSSHVLFLGTRCEMVSAPRRLFGFSLDALRDSKWLRHRGTIGSGAGVRQAARRLRSVFVAGGRAPLGRAAAAFLPRRPELVARRPLRAPPSRTPFACCDGDAS